MNKEEGLNDFLKGLRTGFSNAAAYPKDHPYFIKSVEAFKKTIQALFPLLSPVKIDISPESLLIDGKKLEKAMLYTELASFLHQRKIKSIEFKEGVLLDELASFFSSTSLPVKEIPKKGGLRNILGKANVRHIVVDELDYSALLGSEGEEIKDAWLYIFNEALSREDSEKIEELADNFGKIISKLKPGQIAEDKELQEGLNNFLTYLKENKKDKFNICSSQVFKSIAKYGTLPDKASTETVKALFKNCDTKDFAGLLWDEVLTDDNFDSLSLDFFSQISGGEPAQNDIAVSFLEKAKDNKEVFFNNPKAVKKTQHLLSIMEKEGVSNTYISEVYRNTLSSLLKDTSSKKSAIFDRKSLHENYLSVLLNMLAAEKARDALVIISERMTKELGAAVQERNFAYLKDVSETIRRKNQEDPRTADIFEGINKGIFKFVEGSIWDEPLARELEYFIDNMDKSYLGIGWYMDKIFNEGIFNPYALKLFFRLFPSSAPLFYENLSKKASEMDFLSGMIGALNLVNPAFAKEALKQIYYLSNLIIKAEVLKAMQRLKEFDREFILSVLDEADTSLKRESLRALAKDESLVKPALDKLFLIPSPWGKNNKVLLENIMLVQEAGLKQAKGYLEILGKRRFFWNAALRKKAREVIGEWNV
ncbi:MAG TPA: hypothetical protein VMD04_03950 [Candidatus Margulisiibacteriota bacterium]|nr:hypothetical protein [Candidatus Margulisiibacteriota bacterium]